SYNSSRVAKKNSQPSTISIRSSNVNNICSMIQSTNSNTITSADSSIYVSLPTNRTMNANMPQPPPSASPVTSSFAIPSDMNQDIDPTSELKESSTNNQEQSIVVNNDASNKNTFNDENDRPGNLLRSNRQSERIKKSKRTNKTSSNNSSVRKKRKNNY
ncbi:unnamed protein product, partial [Rotaria magnacalcarata]